MRFIGNYKPKNKFYVRFEETEKQTKRKLKLLKVPESKIERLKLN